MVKGSLFVCPTPIGNLEDITLRILRILKEVDLIAAEDTRRTIKLLNHYDIKKSLISYHEHNKWEKGKVLLEKLRKGKNIALVSDAGMPGISDPGEELIKSCIEEDIEVVVLPGPSASITGLVLSGFSTERFIFEGFLPSNKKDRIKELDKLKKEERTIIFYESPYRVISFLKDVREVLGNRQVSISRELTKVYEETFRGTVEEGIKYFENQKKGEFVIVIEGTEEEEENPFEEISVKEHLKTYMEKGFSKKDAVKKVASERKISKNQVYKESLSL